MYMNVRVLCLWPSRRATQREPRRPICRRVWPCPATAGGGRLEGGCAGPTFPREERAPILAPPGRQEGEGKAGRKPGLGRGFLLTDKYDFHVCAHLPQDNRHPDFLSLTGSLQTNWKGKIGAFPGQCNPHETWDKSWQRMGNKHSNALGLKGGGQREEGNLCSFIWLFLNIEKTPSKYATVVTTS